MNAETYKTLCEKLETISGISPLTKAAYKRVVDFLARSGSDYKDPKQTLAAVELNYSNPSTRKQTVACLVGYLKRTGLAGPEILATYQGKIQETSAQVEAAKKPQEATEHEEANWLKWEEVLEAAEKIKKDFYKSITDLENAVLVALHTEALPPVRNDYATLGFSDESPNWIDLQTGQITLREHKTEKQSGTLYRQASFSALLLLHLLLQKSPRTKLFAADEKAVSKRLIRAFETKSGKKIGSRQLRHIYISYLSRGEASLEQKQAIAKDMGHSVNTQTRYRRPDLG